jgi:hypothetical protein
MLVACRLAGLSGLEKHYAGTIPPTQSRTSEIRPPTKRPHQIAGPVLSLGRNEDSRSRAGSRYVELCQSLSAVVLSFAMRADARFCSSSCRGWKRRWHAVFDRGWRLRLCAHCGKPLAGGLDAPREGARFCSTKCRVAAHRARQD